MSKSKPPALDQPVHVALLKPTHVQTLANEGRLPVAVQTDQDKLPHPQPKSEKHKLKVFDSLKSNKVDLRNAQKVHRQQRLQVRVGVQHRHLESPSGDRKPPCESCKTAACCYLFVVPLTQLEYDSGLYGDAAIKLDSKIFEQLQSKFLRNVLMLLPDSYSKEVQYTLEGLAGFPCPFLRDNNCSIYNTRPSVCRMFTCIDSELITDEVRSGAKSFDEVLLKGHNK